MNLEKQKTHAFAAVMVLSVLAMVIGCDEPEGPEDEHLAEIVADPVDDEVTEEEESVADEADEYGDVLRGELRELPEVPDNLDELPEGLNIVQLEMRLLTAAMQNILQLIADERLDEIPGQIAQVHPAYDLTHQALEDEVYRPPVNPDQIEEFVEADDEFHDVLRDLVGAARDDDLQGVTDHYSQLLEGCASCHGQFRFP